MKKKKWKMVDEKGKKEGLQKERKKKEEKLKKN